MASVKEAIVVQNSWDMLLRTVAGSREKMADWLILTPSGDRNQLRDAERALARLGKELPGIIPEVLDHWYQDGARLLIETVPRLLNPDATADELNPTGQTMHQLFPAFCRMIERTEDLAILIEVAACGDVLIAGRANQATKPSYGWSWSDDGRRPWAYYCPEPGASIEQWERTSGWRLSPQMRQLYLRMGGATLHVDPYLLGPRDLVKGILFTEIYHELVDDLHLSPTIVDRLQSFVVLYWGLGGDDIGFFPDEEHDDGEYIIHQWNHETVEFERYADDFAGAVQDLVGYAVADDT